jgi:hypothetical protein
MFYQLFAENVYKIITLTPPGCGAAEAEQRGQPERRDPDHGHEPHQDRHHRVQPAHPATGQRPFHHGFAPKFLALYT